MGGSSKKVTVGYKYYVGMHMVLHHGSADRITNVKVDGREVFLGSLTGGSVNLNKPSLFGGESREGGIKGQLDFETGLSTQTPNSYLASKLGSFVTAFRGVTAVVLRQMYMGTNPYLKPWAFRVQRINKRHDGSPQWYLEKAIVATVPEVTFIEDLKFPATSASVGPYAGVTINSGFTANDIIIVSKPENLTYKAWSYWLSDSNPLAEGLPWTNAFWVTSDSGTTLYWGGEVDEAGKVTERYATLEEANAAHANDFVYLTGSTSYTFWIMDTPVNDNRGGLSLRVWKGGNIDMNPSHIIRECLTDPDWGMGYQDSDIDDDSFIAAADVLYNEGMGISILWDTQTSIEEFVKEIIKHIDAALFVDRRTGKFTLKLVRADFDEETLIVLDESNIDKITDFKRPTFGELINSVTVTYWDSAIGEESTITVSDIALAQQQGNNNLTSLKYQGFTNGAIASRVAQRDLKQLSTPLVTCTIYTNRDADDLNIGSVFKLNWPDYDVDNLVMRVTGIAYGDGKSNRIRIQCAQDVFTLPNQAYIPESPPIWEDPSAAPVPVVEQVAFEVPYLELVQAQGQAQVDGLLAGNPDAGYVAAAAVRPASSALYTRLFTDNGAGYEEAGQVDFSPSAVLSEDISRIQETFDIEDQQDFDEIVLGSWFQMGTEIMGYLGISGNTVTVQRGCLDTVPVEHSAGEALIFWDYYADGDPTEYVASDVVSVKLPTVTGGGQLELAAAPVSTVALASRAFRPYPPGNFKINGFYFPDTVDTQSPVVLSWNHRSRTQQTTLDLVDFFEGDVGPEAGTSYVVQMESIFSDNTSSIFYEEDVGTALSHSIDLTINEPPLGSVAVVFKVYSKRDGYLSTMPQSHKVELLLAPYDLIAIYSE